MSINKLIVRLHMLTLSPIFPTLLAFIIITIYKLFFDPLTLCDDGSTPLLLDQLQSNLAHEMGKTSRISQDIAEFNSFVEEMKETSSGELSSAQKEHISDRVKHLKTMYVKSLKKTMEIEVSIKKINPSFTTGNENLNANIVRTLEQNIR